MKYFTAIVSSLLLFVAAGSILSSCWGVYNRPDPYMQQKRWAWKPIYAIDTSYRTVSYTADTPVVNAGKIYVKDNFIYQCEVGVGIHVIDNTNPTTAKRIGFIRVPGSEEISIKGNVLYTNNYYDLVAIDITNFQSPRIISRTPKAFFGAGIAPHSWEQPEEAGYYECPNYYDDSVIVNWVKDSVYAGCYK